MGRVFCGNFISFYFLLAFSSIIIEVSNNKNMKNLLIISILAISFSVKAQSIVKYEEPFIGVKIYDFYEKGKPDTLFLVFFFRGLDLRETKFTTEQFSYKEFRELKKYISAGLPYHYQDIETDGEKCFVQLHTGGPRLIITEELLNSILANYKEKISNY
jgi:hypothetical protein